MTPSPRFETVGRGPEPHKVRAESSPRHDGVLPRHGGEPTRAPPIPWAKWRPSRSSRSSTPRCTGDALAHLQRLALSWRLLADLSFADLLLLAPIANEDGHRFVVLAQVRPTTGQTLYVTDLVGHVVDEVERPLVTRAWRKAEEIEGEANVLGGKERVRLQCIPVRHRGRVIAVVTREAPTTSGRRPGELERYYLEAFDRLARMVTEGSFPFAREEIELEGAPRVGDGVILLDADARHPLRQPELGQLAAPHGDPRVHVRACTWPRSASTRARWTPRSGPGCR